MDKSKRGNTGEISYSKRNTVNKKTRLNTYRKSELLKTAESVGIDIADIDAALSTPKDTAAVRYTAINTDYFDEIDTPIKAYLFGYILGDGFMHSSNGRYCVGVHVSIDDYPVVDKLRSELGYPESAIAIREHGGRNKTSIQFRAYRKKIVDGLLKNGMQLSPHTNKEVFTQLSTPELTWNMLRGIVDSDGCIFVKQTDRGSYRGALTFYISKKFLYYMRDFMVSEGLDVEHLSIRSIGGTGSFSIGRYQTLLEIRDKLYPENCFCLERKREKFFLL